MFNNIKDTLRKGDWVEIKTRTNGIRRGLCVGVDTPIDLVPEDISYYCRLNVTCLNTNNLPVYDILIPTKSAHTVYKVNFDSIVCKVYNPTLHLPKLSHPNNFREENFPDSVRKDFQSVRGLFSNLEKKKVI